MSTDDRNQIKSTEDINCALLREVGLGFNVFLSMGFAQSLSPSLAEVEEREEGDPPTNCMHLQFEALFALLKRQPTESRLLIGWFE